MDDRPHVVIIGAGFGGLATAKELAHDPVRVTIVDRNNFQTFQPLLYQVATAGLNAADVAYPVRGIFQRQANVAFRRSSVVGVDWPERTLLLADGPMPFDHLVIAAGATANYFGIDGAEEHSFPLYNLRDAVHLRNHVLSSFEATDADPSLLDDGALTFVVVGGGPTGVEVAGALVELFDMVLRKDFRHLDVGRARVVLAEMGPSLLPPFAASSQRHAAEVLGARGVEVRTGTAVQRVTPTRVHLADGEVINAHTLVWAAGVQANPLVRALGVETGRAGRIVVAPHLEVAGHHDVYAVGDVAAIAADGPPAPESPPVLLPQVAQVAMQSGRHAGRQIRRRMAGQVPEPFHYKDKGIMATIGRRSAVAELPQGPKLHGTLGWLSWLGLHLVYLMGARNRVSVFVNWAWNYLTWDRGPRLILDRVESDRAVDD